MRQKLVQKSSLSLLLCGALLLCGCGGNAETSAPKAESRPPALTPNTSGVASAQPTQIVTHSYPATPPAALQEFLSAFAEDNVPDFAVGSLVTTAADGREQWQIPLYFRGEAAPSCLIAFRYTAQNELATARADARASFTVAFLDAAALDDMENIAVPIFQYLDQALAPEGAREKAALLRQTLTQQGYSDPQDIGGYQMQLHNTSPEEFFRSGDFVSSMGFSVRALAEIWGEVDTGGYISMTPENYVARGKNGAPNSVYLEGVVTEWYKKPDYYGSIETYITVEGDDGFICQLRMLYSDTPYEFALGRRYMLFVALARARGPAPIYAIPQQG